MYAKMAYFGVEMQVKLSTVRVLENDLRKWLTGLLDRRILKTVVPRARQRDPRKGKDNDRYSTRRRRRPLDRPAL